MRNTILIFLTYINPDLDTRSVDLSAASHNLLKFLKFMGTDYNIISIGSQIGPPDLCKSIVLYNVKIIWFDQIYYMNMKSLRNCTKLQHELRGFVERTFSFLLTTKITLHSLGTAKFDVRLSFNFWNFV